MNTQILDISKSLWNEILEEVNHDIYQLPEYVGLEANRMNKLPQAILISDGDKLFFVPYLISRCDEILSDLNSPNLNSSDLNLSSLNSSNLNLEEIFDAQSPYGYSGILFNKTASKSPDFINLAMNEFKGVLKEQGFCSIFLRMHPILNDSFFDKIKNDTLIDNGETVSVDLRLSEAEIWNHTKSSHRNKINKCKRNGFIARMVDFNEYLNQYIQIYEETMERVTAKNTYLSFDREYCLQLKKVLGEKLHLCIVECDNEVASAGLYTECGGIVQSLFGGTKNKFIKYSPSSLETDYARFWSKERGNKFFHLGGGLGGQKDSLYNFKAGFSRSRHTFYTMRIIVNQEKYRYLLELKAEKSNTSPAKLIESNFFPAYRASV